MRYFTFLFVFFLMFITSYNASAQNVTLSPKVEERVELMGIIFRLAGAFEYQNNSVVNYTKSIDEYFKPYINDEVIKFAKKIRSKRGVSFDAVMSLAVHIEIKDDSIKFIENVQDGSLDDRWGKYSVKFVGLLNDFYTKSNFHKFFMNNKTLYSKAEERFTKISDEIDLSWFKSYFGYDPQGTYNLILSLVNMGNYGPDVKFKNNNTNVYSIICAWETDSLGFPVYSSNVLNTIVHEFCHSFCNQLGDKYFSEMKTVADAFYKVVSDKMRMQAYGYSQTMVNEILVRAATIKYFQAHNATDTEINKFTRFEQANGFLWIEPLLDALSEYEKNRVQYKTLMEFMPEIVKLQNSLSPEKLAKELEENSPKVISFSIQNNDENIDPNTKEITIVYDRAMSSYGISNGKGGAKNYPKILSVEWKNDERKELIVNVELVPKKEYSLRLYEEFNQDRYGFTLDKMYELNFKTKE